MAFTNNSLYALRFSSVFSIPFFSRRLPHVDVLSSAAKTPVGHKFNYSNV